MDTLAPDTNAFHLLGLTEFAQANPDRALLVILPVPSAVAIVNTPLASSTSSCARTVLAQAAAPKAVSAGPSSSSIGFRKTFVSCGCDSDHP